MNDIRTIIHKHTREKAIDEAVRRAYRRWPLTMALMANSGYPIRSSSEIADEVRSEFRKIMSGA